MIREATAADRFRIIEMTTRFILESQYHHWLSGATPERIGAYVDAVLESGVIFVYELGNYNAPEQGVKILGMLALLPFEHPLTGQRVAEEFAWWVDPEHRRGLAGPRLLAHMERWCVQNRLHMVKMVAPDGSSVGDFYNRSGYQALETHWIKVLTDGSDDKPRDRSGTRRRPTGG
jgi:GNAT superfamily N-acetyltransferase